MIKALPAEDVARPSRPPTTPWATASAPPASPRTPCCAYLHTDLLYTKDKEQHPRALAQIAQLWRQLKRDDRADEVQAKLKQEYPRKAPGPRPGRRRRLRKGNELSRRRLRISPLAKRGRAWQLRKGMISLKFIGEHML